MKLPLAACLLALVGCAHPLNNHYTLVVDTSFQGYERAQVDYAIAAWQNVTTARFDVEYHSHEYVEEHAGDVWGDPHAFLFRDAFRGDPGCPGGKLPPSSSAQTFFWPSSTVVTCVEGDWLMVIDHVGSPVISTYRANIVHELGHVLGLVHEPTPSDGSAVAMFWHDGPLQADHPTCSDVKQYFSIWGLDGIDPVVKAYCNL